MYFRISIFAILYAKIYNWCHFYYYTYLDHIIKLNYSLDYSCLIKVFTFEVTIL